MSLGLMSPGMWQIHLLGLDAVADSAVFEVDVAHAFGAGGLGPIHRSLVVAVEASGPDGVWEVHVIAAVSDGQYLLHCLLGCADLCFAC